MGELAYVMPPPWFVAHETFINRTKTKKPQLSLRLFADRTGLEPATSAVTGRHSNQLNYRSLRAFPVAIISFGSAKIGEQI
jgi:hypothetical protein